jgi:hypothetical protein
MSYSKEVMEQREGTPEKFIPLPPLMDKDAFQAWLNTYIIKPFAGFEDLKHKDGTPYSLDEQLRATRQQYFDLSYSDIEKNPRYKELVIKRLHQAAIDQNKPKT